MIILTEEHQYFVDGERKPGVSEILSHFGFNKQYEKIPEDVRERALGFGKAVHEVVRLTEIQDTAGFNEGHKRIQSHWEAFKKAHDLADCIVDVKTNASKKPTTSNLLQLFAYKILAEDQTEKLLPYTVEKSLFSKTWNFCGTPDYIVTNTGKIKKLYIVCLGLDGFKPFVYGNKDDMRWEHDFKALLKTYQLQKKEGVI